MGTYFHGKSNSGCSLTVDTDLDQGTLEAPTNQPQQSESLTIETTRFGQLTVSKTQIITVLGGLLGFPEYTGYAILDHDSDMGIPFGWLQSVENPALAFVIIDPWVFKPDYALDLSEEICESLQISEEQPPLVFAIVTVPLEPALMSANLQGPLLINVTTRQARQAVLVNSSYTIQHFILGEFLQTENGEPVASSPTHPSKVQAAQGAHPRGPYA